MQIIIRFTQPYRVYKELYFLPSSSIILPFYFSLQFFLVFIKTSSIVLLNMPITYINYILNTLINSCVLNILSYIKLQPPLIQLQCNTYLARFVSEKLLSYNEIRERCEEVCEWDNPYAPYKCCREGKRGGCVEVCFAFYLIRQWLIKLQPEPLFC